MKIALTGASGTGKTSVAESFFRRGDKDYNWIKVNSRELLSNLGLGLADNISSSEYRVFQTMYLSLKINEESKAGSFYITERSFADCLAYWRMHCAETATKSENNIIENLCKNLMLKYDKHFFFPTGYLKLENDGFRHTSKKYHQDYQKLLFNILIENGIEPIHMPLTSIEERVEFLIKNIND